MDVDVILDWTPDKFAHWLGFFSLRDKREQRERRRAEAKRNRGRKR